ncbi:MAG TPA: asparagine synthase (glutamine-hydrolyzing), partial [Segetibacter sp.]
MCGIAGILLDSGNVSVPQLRKMTDAIAHRGPEGDGFWINATGETGFGHRRLSILDVSAAGAQPMHYQNRYTITYNGEIYNYRELKDQLVKKGYAFASQSDTEVLLAAYACYGKECLQHFDGMFAFAIWDEEEKSLFCARDRFGEKPFYYCYSPRKRQLLFASEMKALWAAGVPKTPDGEMLLRYISVGWVQNPVNKEQTFFEDILSLPPSHYLWYRFATNDTPTLEVRNYWDIDKETQTGKLDDLKEKFLSLFTTSVKRRLRSDVPLGSSLSGGLDSSSIVAIIAGLPAGTNRQKTFSAIFPGFNKDESKEIRLVAERFAIDNFTFTPTANGLIDDFEKLMYHQEEPFQSASIYAQFKVYELAKQRGVTVILDGQGADET